MWSARPTTPRPRCRLARYNPPLDQAQQRAFTLLTSLSQAIERKLPSGVSAENRPADRRCDEALLRWRLPQLGFVAPPNSCPLAEKTALMRPPLSDWVLRHAAPAQWNARNIPLGWRSTYRHRTWKTAASWKRPSTLPNLRHRPFALELEFTESVLIRDLGGRLGAAACRELAWHRGDDFGTGYSNWTYRAICQSPPTLDQSFTRDLAGSPKAQSITQAVIGLASQLGYRVVAEGIETRRTFHLLQAWEGCHEARAI